VHPAFFMVAGGGLSIEAMYNLFDFKNLYYKNYVASVNVTWYCLQLRLGAYKHSLI